MSRTLYYISDGTGISAETLGHSLVTQFEQLTFQTVRLPYVDNPDKAKKAVAQINDSYNTDKERPIVFCTIVQPEIRNIIAEGKGFVIDFFQPFIALLEQELKLPATHRVGLSHAVVNDELYSQRIEAVNFALQCDDGINTNAYQNADIILVGISRSGKTPTSLYLALQFGIRAANYPLTEEELKLETLPASLRPFRARLMGLTITSERLQAIRAKRRPNTPYASKEQCQFEIKRAESLFQTENVPYLNATYLSVEELATHILTKLGLKRRI